MKTYATGENHVSEVPQRSIDLDWSASLSFSQERQLRLIKSIVIENVYSLRDERCQQLLFFRCGGGTMNSSWQK